MKYPIPFLLERDAAQSAIVELEHGQPDGALNLLRRAMSRRGPPDHGPDRRSNDIVRLRAYIEQAIVKLEHTKPESALEILQKGLAPPRQEPR